MALLPSPSSSFPPSFPPSVPPSVPPFVQRWFPVSKDTLHEGGRTRTTAGEQQLKLKKRRGTDEDCNWLAGWRELKLKASCM